MTLDRTALLDALSRFVSRLLTCYDVDEMLDELTQAVTDSLGLAGTAIGLARDGRLECATAAPPSIRALELVQTREQEGPCVDAFRTAQPVAVVDLQDVGAPAAWAGFLQVASELGVRSVAGVPMTYHRRAVGSVNLYDVAPRQWTEPDLAALAVMADMATGYLANASKVHQQEQLTEQLTRALESRVVIEQAKGIVAAQRQIGVEEAFQAIKRHARSRHLSVRAVAEAIVNVGLRL